MKYVLKALNNQLNILHDQAELDRNQLIGLRGDFNGLLEENYRLEKEIKSMKAAAARTHDTMKAFCMLIPIEHMERFLSTFEEGAVQCARQLYHRAEIDWRNW